MGIMDYISIAAIFFTSAAITFLNAPISKKIAHMIGAVDVPKDSRRMHNTPIPRLGGIALYIGFIFSIILVALIIFRTNMDLPIIGMLIGATIIIATGIADDRICLNPIVKFLIQIIAASITVLMGVRIDILQEFGCPEFLTVIITVFWIVGVTNAINLIDGLDGLAVGVSFIAAMTLLAITTWTGDIALALICASIAGACVGFIPFNFNPATIFMGDTGAMFLGFMLASLTVNGPFTSYKIIPVVVPFLILAIPIFDTAVSIARRINAGRSPMSADRGHLHHRLMDLGLSQRQTVFALYFVSIVFAVAAIAITGFNRQNAIYIIVLVFVSAGVAVKAMLDTFKKKEKDSEKKD